MPLCGPLAGAVATSKGGREHDDWQVEVGPTTTQHTRVLFQGRRRRSAVMPARGPRTAVDGRNPSGAAGAKPSGQAFGAGPLDSSAAAGPLSPPQRPFSAPGLACARPTDVLTNLAKRRGHPLLG